AGPSHRDDRPAAAPFRLAAAERVPGGTPSHLVPAGLLPLSQRAVRPALDPLALRGVAGRPSPARLLASGAAQLGGPMEPAELVRVGWGVRTAGACPPLPLSARVHSHRAPADQMGGPGSGGADHR